jgi:hypothetical protein
MSQPARSLHAQCAPSNGGTHPPSAPQVLQPAASHQGHFGKFLQNSTATLLGRSNFTPSLDPYINNTTQLVPTNHLPP